MTYPNRYQRRPITRTPRPVAPTVSSEGLPLSACEFCRASIVWAETWPNPRGRTASSREPSRVPIDAEPSTDHRAVWAVTRQQDGPPRIGEMRATQAAAYRAAGQSTYIKHAKTCTNSAEFRRGVIARHARRH